MSLYPMRGVKKSSRTSSSTWDAVSSRGTAAKPVEPAHVVAISSTARIVDEIDPIPPRVLRLVVGAQT